VTIKQPGHVEHFVKLPNGNYNPPPGSGAELAFDGTAYTCFASDRTALRFDGRVPEVDPSARIRSLWESLWIKARSTTLFGQWNH
jgi:hypothetical protein